ncbi:MAG: TetR family transcriptional regulator, partial [Firmicutes bacterium]|nr:TetR family transcriptional regulator [Bacillota bacterium]
MSHDLDRTTREQILAGAADVFAAKGFMASMKDVAQASGISTTSLIFWHFKDKSSLFFEVVKKASPLTRVEELVKAIPLDQSPRITIMQVVDEYFFVYGNANYRRIL